MKNILFIIALAGVLLSAQLGFGALMNLETPAARETQEGTAAVEGAVRTEGDKLASNAGLLTAQMIGEIKANVDAIVTLNGSRIVADPATSLTEPVDYAIGLGSVRLANVSIEGNTYNFMDSTVNPLLFSDAFVNQETAKFIEAVDSMQPDQIAVIIAIEDGSAEKIDAIPEIKERIASGKVVIVLATNEQSKYAFNSLFEDHGEGFALKSLGLNNPTVVKALQGAV